MHQAAVAVVRLLEMKSDGHLATQCRVNWLPRFPCAPPPPPTIKGVSKNDVDTYKERGTIYLIWILNTQVYSSLRSLVFLRPLILYVEQYTIPKKSILTCLLEGWANQAAADYHIGPNLADFGSGKLPPAQPSKCHILRSTF